MNNDTTSVTSDIQQVIEDLWRELLEVETLSHDANFLELGGNSLQATIFVGRLQDTTGVDIDLEHVFECSLSQLVEATITRLKSSG